MLCLADEKKIVNYHSVERNMLPTASVISILSCMLMDSPYLMSLDSTISPVTRLLSDLLCIVIFVSKLDAKVTGLIRKLCFSLSLDRISSKIGAGKKQARSFSVFQYCQKKKPALA